LTDPIQSNPIHNNRQKHNFISFFFTHKTKYKRILVWDEMQINPGRIKSKCDSIIVYQIVQKQIVPSITKKEALQTIPQIKAN